MRDTELYAQILGLRAPWEVVHVDLDRSSSNVVVHVAAAADAAFACPTCGQPAPGYDRRERRWRHLDTCQYTTILQAQVPRVKCAEHGVVTVAVPWAESGSGFTQLFEAHRLRRYRSPSVAEDVGKAATWLQGDGVSDGRRGHDRKKPRLKQLINARHSAGPRRI